MESLHYSQIVADEGVQCREQLDVRVVEEYTHLLHEKTVFPPLVVYLDTAGIHHLAGGFHRFWAFVRFWENTNTPEADRMIPSEIRSGTKRDAILYAAGDNATHGLRRSAADKRKAVVRLLSDEEWGTWSDRRIADRCAVDHVTVGKIRRELESTGEIHQLNERKSADGKTRNVSNIGKTKTVGESPPPEEPFALMPQFACQVCGEVLDVRQRHCPECAAHWPVDEPEECPRCGWKPKVEPPDTELFPEHHLSRAETAASRMFSEFKKLTVDDRMKAAALLAEELRDYLPAPPSAAILDDPEECELTHQRTAIKLLEKFADQVCNLTAAVPRHADFQLFGGTGITEIFQTYDGMKNCWRPETKLDEAEVLFDWFKRMTACLVDQCNHDQHTAELARRAAEEYDPDVDRDYWPEFDVDEVEPTATATDGDSCAHVHAHARSLPDSTFQGNQGREGKGESEGMTITKWSELPDECKAVLREKLERGVGSLMENLREATDDELRQILKNHYPFNSGYFGCSEKNGRFEFFGKGTSQKLGFEWKRGEYVETGHAVLKSKDLIVAVREIFNIAPTRKTLSAVPTNFQITDEMREWAATKCPEVNADLETEKFTNFYLSKGERRADWNAAWRNWMLKAVEFAPKKPAPKLTVVKPDEDRYITQPLDDEDAREQLEIAYLNECERIGTLAFQEVPDGDRIQRVREMRGRLADQLGKPYTRMAIEAQHDRAVLSIVREIGMGKLSFEDFRSAQTAKVERKSA